MRRWTRRYWLAAAGALALHALLLAVLLVGARAAPPRLMRVELIRAKHLAPARFVAPAPTAPAAPAASPSPAASHAPAASPAPARRAAGGQRAAPAVPAPRSGSPASPPSASASSAPPDDTGRPAGAPASAGKSPAWLAREGLARGGLSLELDPRAAAPAGGGSEEAPGQGLVREKSRAEQLAEEKATVARKVEGWLSDVRAKDRAQTGRDAYWQTIEDALARGFDPGWDMLGQGPEQAAGSRGRQLLEAWQRSAAAYGRSGNPFGDDPNAPGARQPLSDEFTGLANEERGLGSVSLGNTLTPLPSLSRGAAVATGKAWEHRLSALIRITQREDGSLFGVELLGTSGSPSYDRLALGQARGLGKLKLGPPRQGRETLWAFEADFTQVPPLPIVGCSLDDFIPKDCFYPLQKRVRSRVRLQAIY